MKFTELSIPPAGTWIRDCELFAFNMYPHLTLEFSKESNKTKWKIEFKEFIAFKVTSHEFSVQLISLDEMPNLGAFFIFEGSPWLSEIKKAEKPEVLAFCKHFIFFSMMKSLKCFLVNLISLKSYR